MLRVDGQPHRAGQALIRPRRAERLPLCLDNGYAVFVRPWLIVGRSVGKAGKQSVRR
jgi:hypothetical protein